MAKSSSLNVCDNQKLAKSLLETCLVLLILVITSSYSSFINSDGSPSGDSLSLSWHLMCTVLALPHLQQRRKGTVDEMKHQKDVAAVPLVSSKGQSGDHNWKKNQRLGREQELQAESFSLSCNSLSFCSTVLACCTSKTPSAFKKKEICISRLKIHRWWNVPRREECALLFLASRGINWTHFLLPFTGDQQKRNSSDLLGRGRGWMRPQEGSAFWGVV